jgi:hypothetical protein
VPLLFAVTLFVSASLLFMVQPMVGKMVLPLLGGSPAVWNGCMVFFQALLLLGYLYAHWVTTRFEPKKQWKIHITVLMLPVAAMVLSVLFGGKHTPIAVAESLAPSGGDSSPILSVLAIMAVAIGIPFLVASTSAPLIQKWFAYTGHPSARDPYFLYAASNAGSLISLLGYPIFIEPYLTLGQQAWLFAMLFGVVIALIVMCGSAAANPIGVPPMAIQQQQAAAEKATDEPPPSMLRKLKWIALTFVPSSLMLGVTTHMTTDIASIPLLWIIPLALYLLTFIIAFGNTGLRMMILLFLLAALAAIAIYLPGAFAFALIGVGALVAAPLLGFQWAKDVWLWFGDAKASRLVVGNLAPVMILLLVFLMVSNVSTGTGVTLALHIATFFFAALMCHTEFAYDRPSPRYLTEYYLLMSVGGVIGGLFNSIIAPMAFTLLYEYPIALVVACLLVPKLLDDKPPEPSGNPELDAYKADRQRKLGVVLDVAIPVLVGVLFWQLVELQVKDGFNNIKNSIATRLALSPDLIRLIFVFALPVMVCFFFVDRPVRFALSVAAILGYSLHRENEQRDMVYTERSFFGVLKVEESNVYRRLVHGTTLHGTQIRSYYLHRMDTPVPFGVFSSWDTLLLQGSFANWDPRQEPLTYYHRTGPVGAAFRELRTRKGGADAKSHVAMVGLGTGSASCYALPGQRLTFYEIDPAVKRLVADPTLFELMEEKFGKDAQMKPVLNRVQSVVADPKFFTYVGDARRRGAELDFRMGDARLKLKEDTDRKYSLLLVDAFSSDSIPVHLLTNESVGLYKERMTDDGILMLHISNKFVRLEPVVAAIAQHHGLVARVWNDDGERRPGKTASSWVALAKDVETLGTLGLSEKDQEPYGTAFRDVEGHKDVPAWTDDYSDVLRVMMIPELQRFRKALWMPVPVER